MQAQTARRRFGNQSLVVGLLLAIVLASAIAAIIGGIDVLPSGGSETASVQQSKPVFQPPADRTGIGSTDAIGAPGREFHLPTDRVPMIGDDGEPAPPANRPLDRGIGGS